MEQLVNSIPTTQFTRNLMKKIDRKYFVIHKARAYQDNPLPLMSKQTISAPHMHARAIEYLEKVLKPGKSILDIGSGSGYLTACYAEAVKVYHLDGTKRGTVVGVEVFPELVHYSTNVIQNHFKHLMKYKKNFKLVYGDGKKGYPRNSNLEKYDGIHIGAACDFIPQKLLAQLRKGGIMAIPLKINGGLFFTIINKDRQGNLRMTIKESVRYVPLL